uniref:BZIP14 n=1 Tax=Tamarix hispida TaxID=189793 RepID=I7C788_9CARY|nr:bZIP14 [Tamarix hispida]
MVLSDTRVITHNEMNSPMPNNQSHPKTAKDHPATTNGAETGNAGNNYVFSSLGRQSSIYSLTLDEFQHTLCDGGKNFGSMNMDEFLNSIWTAEENQQALNVTSTNNNNNSTQQKEGNHNNTNAVGASNHHSQALTNFVGSNVRGLANQPSLGRQGSLTLPAPLCRKTVDEVWSEIQRSQHQEPRREQRRKRANNNNPDSNNSGAARNSNKPGAQRQQTFGEMTLEDFLIRAGVVQEQGASAPLVSGPPPHNHLQQQQQQQQQHHYGLYQNNNPQVGQAFVRPIMTMAHGGIPAGYQNMPPQNNTAAGEACGYGAANGKRINGYAPAQPTPPPLPPGAMVYGGRVGNGAVPLPPGYGAAGLGMTSPVSPVSSDGMCAPGQVDSSVGHYGVDMGAALGGRKRGIDGPVEKVVERRQRRMIKNRESAARSRARKQAYTVELEAELNQLREENAQLKQALEELERQKNQQHMEEMLLLQQQQQQQQSEPSKAQKAQEKLRVMRRSSSCQI